MPVIPGVPVIPVQITMQLLTTQGIQDFVNAELVPIAAAADLKGALDDEIVKASKPGRSSGYDDAYDASDPGSTPGVQH